MSNYHMTSSLTEQLLDGIFMCDEVRGLWIFCDMGKTSKDGQRGHATQIAYYLTLTTYVQVLWCVSFACHVNSVLIHISQRNNIGLLRI